MLFDKQNLMLDNAAVTVSAVSNSIDLQGGAVGVPPGPGFTTDSRGNTISNDIGSSPELDVLVTVTEQFTASGAATLTVSIVSDDDPNLGSPTVLISSAAIPKAALKPGYQFRLPLPRGINERYLGLSMTVGTGPMTAGRLTAGIVPRGSIQSAPNTRN
jgi:hypothetical protein